MAMVSDMQDEIDERETRITACLESESGDIGGSAGTVSLPMATCKAEEDFILELLSLELVKCFSKVASVRALKPICQDFEGEISAYREHWLNLLRYEVYCKLTGLPSEMVPTNPPSATAREQDLQIEEGTAVDDDRQAPIETRR